MNSTVEAGTAGLVNLHSLASSLALVEKKKLS